MTNPIIGRDADAITTTSAAIAAALVALKAAYRISIDARVESLIADTINALEETGADLEVIADAIHDEAADERAASHRAWFTPYAAV